MKRLSKIEEAVVLEDVFRTLIRLEEAVATDTNKMAIERRKDILAKFGIEGKRFDDLKVLAVDNLLKEKEE